MAEVRNNFLSSKMNKDLDARLVPSGEYRDALNVSISKSEGDDVGALETVLGNISLTDFGITTCNVDIIGKYMDVANDRIIVFMTNYVDTSSDRLSNFSPATAYHAIGVYNLKTLTSTIVVTGRFLNFSKTHSVFGVNMIEELLFWTDNRNQPRKINITRALSNTSYYTSEDHISVAKYYPYETIRLWKYEVVDYTIANPAGTAPGSFYTIGDNKSTTGGTGSGLTVNITSVNLNQQITGLTINNPGIGYTDGDVINIDPRAGDATMTVEVAIVSTMQDVTSPDLPTGNTTATDPNPLYDADWKGDPDYLKEKFVRFSYRFEFDDGEFSLMAPFTQECFIPKQDGYFLDSLRDQEVDDESKTYQSTEVGFVQNKVSNIKLMIPAPQAGVAGGWDEVQDEFKISNVQILYKQSDENAIKVVDTITADQFNLETQNLYQYNYQSSKPWKTLPSRDTLRVYDQVPVRALAQEVANNRVMYGNYIEKPIAPLSLDYAASTSIKAVETATQPNGNPYVAKKEYQNHTLKQKRTYQAGIVLSDRYGRQSTVILSEYDGDSSIGGSTIFNPFKSANFSSDAPNGLIDPTTTWPGDALKLTFYSGIASTRSSVTGAPGLYNATTNPLGWHSYKVVVKQNEQDYYNVYFPGILSGYIDGESGQPTPGSNSEPISHIVLHADNVNKIPRDLSLIDPNQSSFRSGRPSPKDDPSYYKFVNEEGETFTADPYDPDHEALLKARDRKRDLDSGSQITNASVKLSPRVINFTEFLISSLVGGTGYLTTTNVPTTGGSGTGMTVDITVATDPVAGPVTAVSMNNPGTGYQSADIITITTGGANATFTLGINNLNKTKQSYPGLLTDTVTTIGTGQELGLWDAAAASPYNTAPVFYGYQNNPYIGKLEVSDYSNLDKASRGVTGPSPTAGKVTYSIKSTFDFGTEYIAGSENVNTKVVPAPITSGPITTDARGDRGTGVMLDIVAIDDGGTTKGTPGEVGTLAVSNGAWGHVSNENFKGIRGFKDPGNTPYWVALQVQAGDSAGRAAMYVEKLEWPGYMSPTLTVYETEPIESKLDIYWETSTSGLISDLNTKIGTSDSWSPYGFCNGATQPLSYNHNESYALSTNVFSIPFPIYPQRYDGTIISGGNNIFSLASVIDGLGNERKTQFTLSHVAGNDYFNILTNDYFMYGANANQKENYTFYINYTVPASTFVLDGSLITGVLELGYWNGSFFTPTNCQLSNSAPSFSTSPFSPAPPEPVIVNGATGIFTPGNTFGFINGSNPSGSLESEELTFSIQSQTGANAGAFYLETIGLPSGSVNVEMRLSGSYTTGYAYVVIRAVDGGGAYTDSTIVIYVE